MAKISNIFSLLAMAATMSVAFASCNSSEKLEMNKRDALKEVQPVTRAVGNKTPKLTVYIETNDINPLNAKEYYFCDTNPQEEVIDHVILFASNINGTANSVTLHHNENQTYILSHASTLIQPLQQKGIKVLLGILGNHTGVGFANLNATLLESFAQQIATCVTTYGLDGVDFDDEYAKYYQAPSGLPTPSATIYGNLIKRVKQLLPNKLVTAFYYSDGGYSLNFDSTTYNALDYMWPNFGCNPYPPTGFPASKWAKLSIHVDNGGTTYPICSGIQSCVDDYFDYGAIMMFNLRQWNAANIMNCFAPYVWGRNVCWTGVSHAKNY